MKYFSTQTQASLGVCGFFVGAKGVGIGQNEENYRLEFLGKTSGLYQVQKLRNLIFIFLVDLRDLLGGQRCWEWSDREELWA